VKGGLQTLRCDPATACSDVRGLHPFTISCLSVLQACAAVATALGAAAHFVGQQHSKQAAPSTTTNSRVDGPAVAAAAAAAAHADAAGFDDSVRPMTAVEHCKDSADSCTKTSSRSSSCSSRRQHQQDQSPLNQADASAVTVHIETGRSSIEGNLQQQQHEDAATKLQRQRSIQLGDNSRFLGLALAIFGECFLCVFWRVGPTDLCEVATCV
jgi:hypothetical protein